MQRKLPQSSPYVLLLLMITLAVTMVQTASAREMSNHTAKFTQTAPDMGKADPSQIITVKLHLQGQSQQQISDFIQQLHDPSSPNFQKWLTPDQFKSQFGATAGTITIVQNFVAGKNLKVISSDGRSVTVQGTVGDIQNAFHTELHQFAVNGNLVRANIRNPIVDEPVGAVVSAISGLTQVLAKPHSVVARDASGKPRDPIAVDASTNPNGVFDPTQCFIGNGTVSISDGVNTAAYTGQEYGGCAYQPSELATAYNFNGLYSQGLDGTGQTIVIVDAFGSPTLAADVALFDAIYGLPAAQISTFTPNGPPQLKNPAAAGFATETTLDVEWAHAVAPGAKIALVVAPTNSFTDLNAAIEFAVKNKLGPAISNSYGAEENLIDDGTIADTEAILAEGAAAGVSVNYSSGDDGDFDLAEQALNIGVPAGTTTVSYPSGSVFATSVGGTSLFVNADNTLNFQTGWGTNLEQLNSGATFPFPDSTVADGLGFVGGAGGGASQIFPKPHFQRSQPGDFRQQPDISFLADPQTGVEIIQTLTVNKQTGFFVEVIGGTSLACPMFSALWTIGAQAAGGHNIGQAAQTLYDLKDNSISDIRQTSSPNNVTGVITTPTGVINLSASAISQPLFTTRSFVSSLAESSTGALFNLTFGTDSSLTVGNGWDNVTGLGTPNGPTFIQRLVKQVKNNSNSGGGN
ncbi:MAG TPA: S53 family peptidase [Candidatus Angelobacter sp.]